MKTYVSISALLAATLALPISAYAADMSKDTPPSASTGDRARDNVSDAMITGKVKAALAKEKDVSAMRINVDTDNNGVVTLRGTVRSQTEADRAVQVAKGIDGVKSVNNQMQVSATAASADTPSRDTSSRTDVSTDRSGQTTANARRARSDRN